MEIISCIKKLVIFLRGVNANGVGVKMDELKNVIDSMSYSDVIAILAAEIKLEQKLEQKLK